MKKTIVLFIFCISHSIFSQQNKHEYGEEKNKWDVYSNPSTTNFIAKHFEKTIDPKLLNRAKLTAKNSVVVIYFNLNKNDSIHNVRIDSKDKKLNKALLSSFQNIPFDSLHIHDKSPLINYSIQVIKFEKNNSIFKCSTSSVHEKYPVFQGCENEINFINLKKCNQNKLASYIIANFDITLGNRTDLSGVVAINALFKINKDSGKFTDIEVKAPNDAVKFEMKRLLYHFPTCISTGMLNGKPVNVIYSIPIKYPISNIKK